MQTLLPLFCQVLFNYGLTIQLWTVINNNQFTTAVLNSSSLVPFIPFPLIWELDCLSTQAPTPPSTITVRAARALSARKIQQCFSLTWAQWHQGPHPSVRPRSPASPNCTSGQELGTSIVPSPVEGPSFATTGTKRRLQCALAVLWVRDQDCEMNRGATSPNSSKVFTAFGADRCIQLCVLVL